MRKLIWFIWMVLFSNCVVGQVWLPVCQGVRLKNGNPSILSMAYNSATDELFVGGNFDSLCHRFYNGTMKYNGSSWDTLNTVYYSSGHSANVTVMRFDTVILGGTEDGFISKYFGLNSGKSLGYANGAVYDLAYYQGNLYAAGHFTKIEWYDSQSTKHTVNCNNIARWDGTSWYAMGNGLTYQFNDSYVFALKEWNNELYAGGFFKNEYGHCIARWNGSQWLDTIPGFGATWSAFGEEVKALEVYNGQLYAGGFFDRAGKTTAYMIARWDSAIKKWSPLAEGLSSYVLCLNEINGKLWAGGYFAKEGPFPVNHIGYWDETSWHDVGFETGSYVNVMEEYHGDIFVGGGFIYPDSAHKVFSSTLARLVPDSIAVGVTESASEMEQLSIYPNPVSDKLVIEKLPAYRTGRQIENYKLEIIDLVGRILLTTQDTQLKTEIDVSNLPKGIYLLRTKSKSSWQVSKFVKE